MGKADRTQSMSTMLKLNCPHCGRLLEVILKNTGSVDEKWFGDLGLQAPMCAAGAAVCKCDRKLTMTVFITEERNA